MIGHRPICTTSALSALLRIAMARWIFGSSASSTMGLPTVHLGGFTTGIGLRHASFSPDGTKLVYAKGRQIGNLWKVPDPRTTSGDVVPTPSS